MTLLYAIVGLLLALSWALSLLAVYMMGQASLARAQIAAKEHMFMAVKAAIENYLKERKAKNDRSLSGKRCRRKRSTRTKKQPSGREG